MLTTMTLGLIFDSNACHWLPELACHTCQEVAVSRLTLLAAVSGLENKLKQGLGPTEGLV
jgi:hypothetical protein